MVILILNVFGRESNHITLNDNINIECLVENRTTNIEWYHRYLLF